MLKVDLIPCSALEPSTSYPCLCIHSVFVSMFVWFSCPWPNMMLFNKSCTCMCLCVCVCVCGCTYVTRIDMYFLAQFWNGWPTSAIQHASCNAWPIWDSYSQGPQVTSNILQWFPSPLQKHLPTLDKKDRGLIRDTGVVVVTTSCSDKSPTCIQCSDALRLSHVHVHL